ncbi:hypothetical protein Leryth_002864 [Lithospermum erythrorhizon]|nr:hypothetical protein Leryth_002864 [Lithospermum erythrorhizon]
MPRNASLSCLNRIGEPYSDRTYSAKGMWHPCLPFGSSLHFSGDQGSLYQVMPKFPQRRGSNIAPKASKDVPYSYRYPAMTKKPKWWWRMFACLPYLMPLHETWMRKEWPHFFRFHVVMGMLLEIALQVIGTVSRWMPLAVYWGKFGMHFWTAVAFGYLFTVLESIRCALAGMYADIPFV